MTDIQRYEINDAGELPVSYGRYVHWEDVEDLLQELREEVAYYRDSDTSWEDGYDEGHHDGRAAGLDEGRRLAVIEAGDKLKVMVAK